MKKLLMGNEIIAMGALRAGVGLVCGYPGTPSTEVLETVAKLKAKGEIDDVYVEWSVNEKSALEVAAGAAYAGVRCLVTMKQVGLNVAADPLMSLEYVGVKGGLVILVADDPGPISSQTEQDTRKFGEFSKVPVFDPATPEEAYLMMEDAFEFSEKYSTPVFLWVSPAPVITILLPQEVRIGQRKITAKARQITFLRFFIFSSKINNQTVPKANRHPRSNRLR